MKKRLLPLMLLCAALLCSSANALHTTEPAPEIYPHEASQPVVIIPEGYGGGLMRMMMTDPEAFSWNVWDAGYNKAEADPFHDTYAFYTSMGCEDVFCEDETHTHWCPNLICQDPAHGHSSSEYAAAAAADPACPCHKH